MIAMEMAPRRPVAQDRVASLVTSAGPYITSQVRRLELARNVASALLCDEATVRELHLTPTPALWRAHVQGIIAEMIRHRVRHFSLGCDDVAGCVRAMADCWIGGSDAL